MAIGRISGQMLKANLQRSGTDLAFETNLLALDVTNSRVGIGTASPAVKLHVSSTDAIRIPSGTTAQRPGSPVAGMMRYNTDDTVFEGYNGTNWVALTGVYDLDRDTYITAEQTPGADDDTIRFYAGNTLVANVSPTRFDVTTLG